MAKITVHAELGHSPRKELLKNFNIAFAEGNADFIIDQVSDDILWLLYGDKELVGKPQFSKEIHIMKDYVADELVIHSIITHGKEGAVNGEMKMGDQVYAFCDIYQFTSTSSNIIGEMRSYVIKIAG